MIPVKCRNTGDEGYTSSSPEPVADFSLRSLPFRNQGLVAVRDDASLAEETDNWTVTVVRKDPKSEQGKGKKRGGKQRRGKGGSRKWDPEDFWGNGKKYPDPVPRSKRLPYSVIHASVQIPPLPESYNVFAAQEAYFNAKPEKIFTAEEKKNNVLRCLKANRLFDARPVILPKKFPVKVELVTLSQKGTVLIRFLDNANKVLFDGMKGVIKMWIREQKHQGYDTNIQKEDLAKGLLVLAMIKEEEWIRAKVLEFTDHLVKVFGVDNGVVLTLPYSRIFYHHRHMNDCPFQVLHCYLQGLEEEAKGTLIPFIHNRLMNAMRKKLYKDIDADDSDDDDSDDDDEDIRKYNFTLTKLKKLEPKGYSVELNVPDEVATDVCWNTLLKELTILDPFRDFVFC